MAKVHSDIYGIYMVAGGCIARPISPSSFSAGETVCSNHFKGSNLVGVGKDNTCGKGEYLEYWSLSKADHKLVLNTANEDYVRAYLATQHEQAVELGRIAAIIRSGDSRYCKNQSE